MTLLESGTPMWVLYVVTLVVFLIALGFVLSVGHSRPHS